MLDYLIRGGTVVDGTGAPSKQADVGIKDGRIVSVDGTKEDAKTVLDADGLIVAPGFIDPHTHYDAQLFWDPAASPSNVHGVTTVLGGNCGFTLAPIKDEDADYIRKMMQKVEGMPLEALETGVPWGWETFADYLGALESRGIGVNAGFLVGHCAVRRYVMGADSVGGQPTPDQLDRMVQVLHESLDAGGLGFSTTLSHTHSDGDGNPVPSRHAKRDEVLALCAAVSEHEGTTLEGIVSGCLDQFSEDEVDLLTAMSAAANRAINWNVLTVDKSAMKKRIPHQLDASSHAEKNGARIIALTMPVVVPMNMSLRTFCALFLIPGWADVLSLPIPERMAKLQDPAVRADLLEKANGPGTGVLGRLARFDRYVLGDTFSPDNAGLKGRVIGEIAKERGVDPFTALVDIAVKDELKTVLWPMQDDNDDETWAIRRDVWEDPRVMLGGSDAGAHLDRMCGAPYTTRFLGDMIRGRKLLSVERAVSMITDMPAQTFGIRDRGRVQEGYHADVCVFDPAEIGSEDATLVPDLPGGAARLTANSFGVVRVLVNGVETVVDGKATDATPGTVLRSGRDTYSVTTS